MLENGADVRFIQALLGHADLTSTQIYTHVAIGKSKEIHAATHPAALGAGAHELNEVDSGVDDSAAASLFPRDYLRVAAAIESEADE